VLSRVLDVEPTARRWSKLGDLEYGLERWAAAAQAYRSGLALAPEDGRVWLNLGICWWRLGRLEAAREAFLRASEDPALADHARSLLDRVAR
jgi:Tfp pilus assembly protein PilF